MSEHGVLIVGRGRVGRALSAGLQAAGVEATLARGHAATFAATPGSVVVLAVPDPRIGAVAARLAASVGPGNVVLHCAGAVGVEALAACAARGAATGVMHPLVSFASARHAPPLVKTTWVVGGDPRAVRVARRLAQACEARVLRAAVHGAAYHATAAMLANGAAALAHEAVEALVVLGIGRRAAERATAALLATVAHNVAEVGVPRALTGPIVRGDAETVSRHREALAALGGRTSFAYDAIAPVVLRAAIDAGLDRAAARRLARVLKSRAAESPRRRRRS